MPDSRHPRPEPAAGPDVTATPMATAAGPAPASASAGSRTTSGGQAASPTGRLVAWLRSAADRVALAVEGEPVVDRLAEVSASAREPEEVRVELVRLAWTISGASKVELFSERSGRVSRLASWPTSLPHETLTESRSGPRGPIAGAASRAAKGRGGPSVLQLPLKAGDSTFGTLRLTAKGPCAWSPRVTRRLAALCAIASAAERGLARPASDPNRGANDPTILAAFLSFAHAQARRRHEPLSMMEVAVDRLDSIKELLGEEIAESAIERVSRAIKATVRASDVVAGLDCGRIAILLPNASVENAQKVAESIRAAIARAGSASTTMPSLTASIGLATYPEHAHDVATLRAAASSTLTRSREQGNDRVATAPGIPPVTSTSLAHRAG